MNSGKQIDFFFLFDYNTQEWQKTDLETLAQRDEETATICPVFANGEQGEQTTWGEFLKQKHHAIAQKETKLPVKFRYFDARSYDWKDTTLDALITLNENNLTIVPVFSNGKTEKALTWQTWKNKYDHLIPDFDSKLKAAEQKKQLHQTAAQKKEKEQQQAIEQQNKEIVATNIQELKQNIDATFLLLRKFIRLFIVIFWLNFFAAGALLGIYQASSKNFIGGLFSGLLISAVLYALIITIEKKWARATEPHSTFQKHQNR